MALHRSRDDRIIAGIMGGLAHQWGWRPTTLRVVFVLASALSVAFPGIIVYLALWILMPLES